MIAAVRQEVEIISSNVTVIEADIPVYNPTSTYTLNEVVQVNGLVNRKYKATQDVPIGKDPVIDVNPVNGIGTYWFDEGSTNYFRAFDELSSSKCSFPDQIYFKLSTSDTDLLMFDGLTAQSVRIKVSNKFDGAVLQDETYVTVERDVYDWFDWTYETPEVQSRFFKYLPMGVDTHLEIWINNSGGDAEVGHIAYGRSKSYGLTLLKPNPVTTIRGISTKTRNKYGEIITRKAARYRRIKIHCLIDSVNIDRTENGLERLADKPLIIVGDEREGGYKALLIYGEIRDHDMPISATKTKYIIEVEGYIS